FFFTAPATTEIYTLSLHDALPICDPRIRRLGDQRLRRGGLARSGSDCGSGRSEMKRYPVVLLIVIALALILSGLAPYDRTTWWLEIFPILIGAAILVATHRRFPLTSLVYTLLAVHALILIVGGHYTYARVPLGFWLQDLLGLTRNDYDRIGHFVQGFVPAILIREILLRTSPLRPGRWLFVIVAAMCLA